MSGGYFSLHQGIDGGTEEGEAMSVKAPEEGQYMGYPVLNIVIGKKWQTDEDDVMSIGVKKAVAICEQIDYIRRFADKYEKKRG